jgi:hypothetical protein
VRGFNEALYAARPIIEEAVNNVMRTRKREKYEYSGPFTANVAFCNLYQLHSLFRLLLTVDMLMRRNASDITLIN